MSTTAGFFEILKYLPAELKAALSFADAEIEAAVTEIRMRTGAPLQVYINAKLYFVGKSGTLSFTPQGSYIVTKGEVESAFLAFCGHSVYTHQNELKSGFVTVPGGHRIGVAAECVFEEGSIKTVRNVSSLNIRIAGEFKGCADELMKELAQGGITSALIAGPPFCGKTTVLRDVARQLSSGYAGRHYKVTVVDERGEIAPAVTGDLFDLGPCCDVLTGFGKAAGIVQAVRCLSPEVIICDEMGTASEIKSVSEAVGGGVALIASVHAGKLDDLLSKEAMRRMLDTGAFAKVIFLNPLDKDKRIKEVVNIADQNFGVGVDCDSMFFRRFGQGSIYPRQSEAAGSIYPLRDAFGK